MQTHFSAAEEPVAGALGVAAAEEARAAGVGERLVGFDAEGEVELEVLGRDGFDGGEEAVAVGLFTRSFGR